MTKNKKRESGEVMLESTIVMVIVMLMLVWILGVGFIYYQKYTVRIATSDVANKIAATYDSPTSDPITAYISKSDLTKRSLYQSPELKESNRLRADSYVNYIIKKANLFGTVEDVTVTLEPEDDGMGRSHIKVTTECTFDTPFGEGLKIFGMSDKSTYRVSAYADSTSITEYVSSVLTANALTNGSVISDGGLIDNIIGMIASFKKMCNALSS